jgi:hypothetical protein
VIRQWKSFLLERAREWNLPTNGEWTFLFNNNYHPHCSNLNLLWFHNGGEFPTVVTKLFRDPELPKREFENLQQAYTYAPALVPQPLHFGLHGEFWSLWMRGVPGIRFRARKTYSLDTLRSLAEMVAVLHGGVSTSAAAAGPDRYRRIITEPLQTVAQFGDSAAIQTGCKELAAKSTVDWVTSLPVIPQHGDLFCSNVLSHHRRWCVVDWETYGTIDLPFYDLFTLLYSLLRAGGETMEQWDPALMKQVPNLVECYARRLGLPSGDAALLFPLTLVNWFHLQWSDGRKEFTDLMYKTLQHYFEHISLWQKVFLPPTTSERKI